MTTFYQVDHLLSISRLADRLYPFIFGLKGREEMYQNPGTSLKSFLVVNLREELVELDNEQLENLQACEEFASAASVSVIVSSLRSQSQLWARGGAGRAGSGGATCRRRRRP